jgi:hypothetical protein
MIIATLEVGKPESTARSFSKGESGGVFAGFAGATNQSHESATQSIGF